MSPVLKAVVTTKYGTIVVEADVPGAEVYVDGNKHPDSTPTVISNVIEGLHVVEVRKSPAMPWKQTVQVVADTQVKVRAELQSTLGGAVGSIRVLSNVPTARVYLDGVDRGAIEQGVDLKDIKPGEHVIEVRAAGHQSREERVTVNAGSSAVLKLDLTATVATDEGTLKVISAVPGAQVFIDGEPVGRAPQEKRVGAGEHFVRVDLTGYKPFEQKVRVEAGQVLTVQAELQAVGQLRLISNPPGASILINGMPASGVTPLDTEVAAGTTVVRIELPGFDAQERTLEIGGGRSETISVTLERSAPTGAQAAAEQRGLSSFGARTLPRGRSTVDMGAGFPYFLNLKIGVGAGRVKNFGFDAGVQVRTMLARSELGLGARLMLVDAEPFSLGAFGDLWWGSKLLDESKRNGATFDLGVAASLTALTHVTVTGRAWLEAWSDRHCPALTDAGDFDGEPIDSCASYKAYIEDMAGNAGFAADAARMEELTGSTGLEMFDRDGGARVMMSVGAEIAVRQRWNVWFVLEGAPFQDERALFTGLFTGPMFDSDFGTYGKAGLTYKF
ncbi:MAG: PEGA domain-containing protein [Kofleriaceae bacterium]